MERSRAAWPDPRTPRQLPTFSIQEGEISRETDCLLEGDGFEPSVPRRKTRVLLVDDEEVTRCLVRQLAPRGIYDVREARPEPRLGAAAERAARCRAPGSQDAGNDRFRIARPD
jgi:hypothetical protein